MKPILEQVQDELRDAGIVTSAKEFCEEWLGKSECYLRSLRFNGIAPSADALANCVARLAWASEQLRAQPTARHHIWADKLDNLRGECNRALREQAALKWKRKGFSA